MYHLDPKSHEKILQEVETDSDLYLRNSGRRNPVILF